MSRPPPPLPPAPFPRCAVSLVLVALVTLGLPSCPRALADRVEERVCRDVEVRRDVTGHLAFRNCSVVLGFLRIINVNVESEGALTFPLLREVTDYVLLYKVGGVSSLHEVFPALTVVRGQRPFSEFALVVNEAPDLVELGLEALGWLGSNVHLKKNYRLCFVRTVDWDALTGGGLIQSENNRQPGECPDDCPPGCKHCWSSTQCQRQLDCQNCGTAGCHDGTCCHAECLGGCVGPGPQQCLACLHVRHQGVCLPACPLHLYMLLEARCVSEVECLSEGDFKLVPGTKHSPGSCVRSCPPGYMLDSQADTHCKRCPGDCPKECKGKIVDNLGEALSLKGCTKILGNLEVQIKNGHMVGIKMEEGLGSIEEITGYLKVVRSDALLSLHFFSSLRIIRGQELSHGLSFSLHSNKNLEKMFRSSVTRNLTIERGELFILNNRKLCVPVIRELLASVGKNESEENLRTNGDRAACSVRELELKTMGVGADFAILAWSHFSTSDLRRLMSYELFYRQIDSPDAKIDIYEGRDACQEVIWMTKEVDPSSDSYSNVDKLRPWTWYAAFVQTVMMAAPETAISPVITFRTKPTNPSVPTMLKVEASGQGEMTVTWEPPRHPNGNVTHYVIYWTPVHHSLRATLRRDACERPQLLGRERRHVVGKGTDAESSSAPYNETCCACQRPREGVPKLRYTQADIQFDDLLRDLLYTKGKKGSGRHDFEKHLNVTPAPPSRAPTTPDVTTPVTTPLDVSVNVTTASSTSEIPNVTLNVTQPLAMATVYFGQEYVITGLSHFTTYKIEVMACQDGENKRCSLTNATKSARTLPSKVADAINSSSVVVRRIANRTDQVFVTWLSPAHPNGAVLSYEIQYSRILKGEERRYGAVCQTELEYREAGGYHLTPLEPGNYSVRIRANTLAGNGSFTVPMFFLVPVPPGSEPMGVGAQSGIALAVLTVIAATGIFVWWMARRSIYKQALLYRTSPNPCYISSSDLYIPDGWEVPREKIRLLSELGKGSFGKVYEGIATDVLPDERFSRVAVKTVNDSAGFRARLAALKEATIMKEFRTPHVVKLLGVVSRGEPAFIIMELMALGDLKNYLRDRRPDRQMEGGEGLPTLMAVLQMAAEISDGMAYLADKKFVHCDLAARNCMVAEDRTVKIGDFGLARDIYEGDYYRKGGRDKLPIRWMAPESLTDGVFTSQSDIWALGVVLWEMVTLAEQPYQGLSNEEVLQYVRSGLVMEQPVGCPDELYELMRMCWTYRPERRPTFHDVLQLLLPYLHERFRQNSYFYSEENQALMRQSALQSPLDDDYPDRQETFPPEAYTLTHVDLGGEEVSSHSGEGDEYRKPLCAGYPPSLGGGTSEEGERGDDDDEDEDSHSDGYDDCRTPFIRRMQEGVGSAGGAPTPTPTPSPSNNKRNGGEAKVRQEGRGEVKGYIKPYDAIIMKELPNGHCTSSPPLSPTLTVV